MVDMATYKLMHGDEHEDQEPAEGRTELGDDEMSCDDVPPEPFALLLPATVRGFGFHNKKWSMQLYAIAFHISTDLLRRSIASQAYSQYPVEQGDL
jgi:hypothetical protein